SAKPRLGAHVALERPLAGAVGAGRCGTERRKAQLTDVAGVPCDTVRPCLAANVLVQWLVDNVWRSIDGTNAGGALADIRKTWCGGVRSTKSPLEEDETIGGPELQDHFCDDVLVRHRPERPRVGRELTVVAKDENVTVRDGEREPHGRRLWGRRLAARLRELD